MSAEMGRVTGYHHPISVSTSSGGVELGIWTGINPRTGIGVGMTPQAARGLAALLERAADYYDAQHTNPTDPKRK